MSTKNRMTTLWMVIDNHQPTESFKEGCNRLITDCGTIFYVLFKSEFMKKIFIYLVLATTFIGCTPNEEIEINIYETSYEEHSYLVFDGIGVIHNPKCECYVLR